MTNYIIKIPKTSLYITIIIKSTRDSIPTMGLKEFKIILQRLEDAILNASKPQDTSQKYRFVDKAQLYSSAIRNNTERLSENLWQLMELGTDNQNKSKIITLFKLMQMLEEGNSLNDKSLIVQEMKNAASTLVSPASSQSISYKTPNIPSEIREDVIADLGEIMRCYEAGCYRSATILCGRILEAALHRKYYETTGFDILEKNPGIGLGKLIAKLIEKNVELDPAITQQIHLINQVRIFSVHKKQAAFNPSKNQTHAMILYTLDIVNKLF